MTPRFYAPTLGSLVVLSLACGGVHTNVGRDKLVACGVQLKGVPNSPEKERVQALLERGWLASEGFGFAAVSALDRKCLQAVTDDVLTHEEVLEIEAAASDWPPPPPPSAADAERLAAFAARVAKKPLHSAFDSWSLDQLEERMRERDLEPESCRKTRDDWGESIKCAAVFEQEEVSFDWTRFSSTEEAREYEDDSLDPWHAYRRDGRVLLFARASDTKAAEAMLTTLLTPELTRPQSREQVDARLKAARFEDRSCSEEVDEDGANVRCTFRARSQRGRLSLTWPAEATPWQEVPQVERFEGLVMHDHRAVAGSLLLWDKASGERALLDLLDASAPD